MMIITLFIIFVFYFKVFLIFWVEIKFIFVCVGLLKSFQFLLDTLLLFPQFKKSIIAQMISNVIIMLTINL